MGRMQRTRTCRGAWAGRRTRRRGRTTMRPPDTLRAEPEPARRALMAPLLPFVVAPFRDSLFYASHLRRWFPPACCRHGGSARVRRRVSPCMRPDTGRVPLRSVGPCLCPGCLRPGIDHPPCVRILPYTVCHDSLCVALALTVYPSTLCPPAPLLGTASARPWGGAGCDHGADTAWRVSDVSAAGAIQRRRGIGCEYVEVQ
ncbi:hypothetical protein B0H17DRAFT_1336755 [Mycena rosella]|uniref:Uncharacterized protein n=1 Tax=Mycena rosella TaxID=1033263 RepID=A0AAD7CUM1_MYCRO|nr:hypothetical protein B0H17DRAFT_1336755 [Mycena rosella]